jgi:hypothetical protein
MMARVLDAATDRPLEGELTFVQVGRAEARIDAVFPRAGDYVLRVFAKPLGADGSLDWVLDYRVQARAGAPDAVFPLAFESFGTHRATLLEPMTGVLQAGQSYRFRLRAPGAIDVAVVTGGRWTHLSLAGAEWLADVQALPGDVVVYARYDPASSFTGVLKYSAR